RATHRIGLGGQQRVVEGRQASAASDRDWPGPAARARTPQGRYWVQRSSWCSSSRVLWKVHSKDHPVAAPTSAGHAHRWSSYTTLLDSTGEGGQVRGREGSVGHVEVFQIGRCRNSHHRKTSTHTPAPTRRPRSHHRYTLDW